VCVCVWGGGCLNEVKDEEICFAEEFFCRHVTYQRLNFTQRLYRF